MTKAQKGTTALGPQTWKVSEKKLNNKKTNGREWLSFDIPSIDTRYLPVPRHRCWIYRYYLNMWNIKPFFVWISDETEFVPPWVILWLPSLMYHCRCVDTRGFRVVSSSSSSTRGTAEKPSPFRGESKVRPALRLVSSSSTSCPRGKAEKIISVSGGIKGKTSIKVGQ